MNDEYCDGRASGHFDTFVSMRCGCCYNWLLKFYKVWALRSAGAVNFMYAYLHACARLEQVNVVLNIKYVQFLAVCSLLPYAHSTHPATFGCLLLFELFIRCLVASLRLYKVVNTFLGQMCRYLVFVNSKMTYQKDGSCIIAGSWTLNSRYSLFLFSFGLLALVRWVLSKISLILTFFCLHLATCVPCALCTE